MMVGIRKIEIKTGKCVWKLNGVGCYCTSCQNLLNKNVLKEDIYKYCPYCGDKIEISEEPIVHHSISYSS